MTPSLFLPLPGDLESNRLMKKLILLSAVMALALVPALRAGDDKAKTKDAPACCQAEKSACGQCAGKEGTCPATAKNSKQSEKAAKQQAKAEKKAAKTEKKDTKKNP